MGATTACILAAVVVLIILIAAVLYLCRAPRRGDPFMPGDPATPKIRDAVSMLGGDLACIVRIADSVEWRGRRVDAEPPGSVPDEARKALAGARQGMAVIVSSVKGLRATLGTMTPTYQNALALYRGLRDSDKALWEAAGALAAAGDHMGGAVRGGAAPLEVELAAAGGQLRQLASCIRSLVRTVHFLGDALGLE